MNNVTIRDLRNRGGAILEQVTQGQALTVTRDGKPVAQLQPLAHAPLPAKVLLSRWRHLPLVDPVKLKNDMATVIDAAL